jgi:uncharacterized protein YacL (UPF0231 family)
MVDILEIREFQHFVQVKMSMHKEHLYDYFRYIRRDSRLLNELQELAKAISDEEPSKKQMVLVDHLMAIKTRSNFVSFIFLLT